MMRDDEGLHIGMHPHSGIGIITYFEGAYLLHDDSGNNGRIIKDGGVQWIRAGGGVWHQEHYVKKEDITAESWPMVLHQLWMQLPPELEESEVEYQNIQPEDLPNIGKVKLIVGEYKGYHSPLKVPYNMTYLDVKLDTNESFEFQTPEGQNRGFIFPRKGNISLFGEALPLQRLAILEENEGKIELEAKQKSEFVLLMAEAQNYPIFTKGGSIHTTEEAMDRSFDRIRSIGKSLSVR